jgi:hypothetical protein
MWTSHLVTKSPRLGHTDRRLLCQALIAFAATFSVALYAMTPDAPGRQALADYVTSRTTDQHFANCAAVRAAGRQNIMRWDPSYRVQMDADSDGVACEPWAR